MEEKGITDDRDRHPRKKILENSLHKIFDGNFELNSTLKTQNFLALSYGFPNLFQSLKYRIRWIHTL